MHKSDFFNKFRKSIKVKFVIREDEMSVSKKKGRKKV